MPGPQVGALDVRLDAQDEPVELVLVADLAAAEESAGACSRHPRCAERRV